MATAVIVQPGLTSTVVVAGTPVDVIPPNINGGIVTNPMSATDQGQTDPEALPAILYVSPQGPAATVAQNETFALQPGQSWVAIPGQTTNTSINSNFAGHRFSVVYW